MGGTRLSPGQAVTALEEAIDVIRELWDTSERRGVFTDGRHHRVHGAKRGPRAAHDIPIWIGAYKPRMLALTGRKGDGWLPSLGYMQPGDLAKGNATIDEAAASVGRDPREIRRLLNIGQLAADPVEFADRLARLALDDGIGTFILAGDDPRLLQGFGEDVAPSCARSWRASAASAARRRHPCARPPPWPRAARASPTTTCRPVCGRSSRVTSSIPTCRATYMRGGAPGIVLQPGIDAAGGRGARVRAPASRAALGAAQRWTRRQRTQHERRRDRDRPATPLRDRGDRSRADGSCASEPARDGCRSLRRSASTGGR